MYTYTDWMPEWMRPIVGAMSETDPVTQTEEVDEGQWKQLAHGVLDAYGNSDTQDEARRKLIMALGKGVMGMF